MLQLIAMFVLGVIFACSSIALYLVHKLFAEDDAQDAHLEEMATWYEEEYKQ